MTIATCDDSQNSAMKVASGLVVMVIMIENAQYMKKTVQKFQNFLVSEDDPQTQK